MSTLTGHTRAIAASKVAGTNVYNQTGENIGQVEDVILDKLSNNILFAVLGFGGFLGLGEKYHAMPWSMLDYDTDKEGYVVRLDTEALKAAPVYEMKDLIANDGAKTQLPALDYYSRFH
jgi:sporulation protein YlmC with PRC-barrel domain